MIRDIDKTVLEVSERHHSQCSDDVGVFTERGLPRVGDKDDLRFNLGRVVDSLARIVETRTRRVSV